LRCPAGGALTPVRDGLCSASKGVHPTRPDPDPIQGPKTSVGAGARDTTAVASRAALQFEQLTPMLCAQALMLVPMV
jgi:hypothetical protein